MPSFSWNTVPSITLSLDSSGLVALADLSTIAQRAAMTGGASLLDIFSLCPGIHREQTATELNKGEYPAVAALTTGYVFRVENPATVFFLQRVGLTGHSVNISVEGTLEKPWYKPRCMHLETSLPILLLYLCPIFLTLAAIIALTIAQDYWSTAIFSTLILARLLNTIVIQQRSRRGSLWKGASEPGVRGDLLALLSQDRWIRIQGLVDDLKAVTSGLWLADMTFAESSAVSVAAILVYLSAALATNMSQAGNLALLVLLLVNTACLALVNHWTEVLTMHGRVLKRNGTPCAYRRRRDLADELIKSSGRKDWALALGIIPAMDEGSKEVTM